MFIFNWKNTTECKSFPPSDGLESSSELQSRSRHLNLDPPILVQHTNHYNMPGINAPGNNSPEKSIAAENNSV